MANTHGKIFQLTTFGESHGPAIGCVVDGCPAGIKIDLAEIQRELDRRRPGQSTLTTSRQEKDQIEVLSGLYDGHSIGSPIAIMIRNHDARSEDYQKLKENYRPSHGDYTYHQKFGVPPLSGGGRLSARETAARVAGGAIASQFVRTLHPHLEVITYTQSIHDIESQVDEALLTKDQIDASLVRCPDKISSQKMITRIQDIQSQGDSVGGIIKTVIKGLPVGLGEPVFDRFEADLAKAMLSLPATKAFAIGDGFEASRMKGSEHNDPFEIHDGKIRTTSHHAGGVLGGMTNGEWVHFRVGFKPTSTIMKEQSTVKVSGELTTMKASGRHDPCVIPRAVPIVEAMTWLVIADHVLRARGNR